MWWPLFVMASRVLSAPALTPNINSLKRECRPLSVSFFAPKIGHLVLFDNIVAVAEGDAASGVAWLPNVAVGREVEVQPAFVVDNRRSIPFKVVLFIYLE